MLVYLYLAKGIIVMLTITLNPKMESRLHKLALQTYKDKSFYVEQTIEEFLEEYKDAIKTLNIQEHIDKGEEKLYSLEEA